MKQRSEQYGPVYKEAIGPFCSVVISDLDEYTKVIAVDGRYPNRAEMEPYAHYLRKRGMVIGIVNRCYTLCTVAGIGKGALARLWKCSEVFLCIAKCSVDELFLHYFHNLASPPDPIRLHPWTPRPRPVICPPLEKILRAPVGA